MDTFSHGFWAAALLKIMSKKMNKKFSITLAFLWGILPDLFSFMPLFIWMFFSIVLGDMSFSDFQQMRNTEPPERNIFPISNLIGILYSLSHSSIVFFIVFGIIWMIYKRPVWELLGWILHIILDIFTHPLTFYPTPFLWPLSDFRFDGIPWRTPWFLPIDYSLIVIMYFLLWKVRSSRSRKSK